MNRNIELIINNQYVDTRDITSLSLNFSQKDIKEFTKTNTSFSKPITVVHTPANDAIFKSAFNINSINGYYTNKIVPGILKQDGFVLLKGNVQLVSIGLDTYDIIIFGQDIDLFTKLGSDLIKGNDDPTKDTVFPNTFMEHTPTLPFVREKMEATIDPTTDDNYVYPVILYDGTTPFDLLNERGSWYNGTSNRTIIYDTYPAIQVKPVFDKIIEDAGYTYEMQDDLKSVIRDLYMPYNGNGEGLTVQEHLAQRFYIGLNNSIEKPIEDNGIIPGFYFKGNPADPNDLYALPYNYDSTVETILHQKVEMIPITFNGTIKPFIKLSLGTFTNKIKIVKVKFFTAKFIVGSNDPLITEYDLGEVTVPTPPAEYTFNVDDGSDDFEYLYVDVHKGEYIGVMIEDLSNTVKYINRSDLGFSCYIDIYVKNYLYSGDNTININDLLPVNYKKVDLVNDIFKMFNCYIEPDKMLENHLIIKTYDELFNQTGITINDWSYKIDENSISMSPANAVMDKLINYKFKAGTDAYNVDYNTQYNSGYKDLQIINDNDFVTSESNKSLGISATAIINYLGIKLPIIRNNENFTTAWEPRMLFYRKFSFPYFMSYGTDYWGQYVGDNSTFISKIPTLSDTRYEDEQDPDNLVLSFNENRSYTTLSSGKTGVTNNTLYNVYHKEDIERNLDKDTKLLKVKVKLTSEDISVLKMNDKIFIKSDKIGDAYYRINSVKNFSGDDKLTEVGLIKLNYYKKDYDQTITPKIALYAGPGIAGTGENSSSSGIQDTGKQNLHQVLTVGNESTLPIIHGAPTQLNHSALFSNVYQIYSGCTDTFVPFWNGDTVGFKDSPMQVYQGKVGLNKPEPQYDFDVSGTTKTDSLILNPDAPTGVTHEIGELYFDPNHNCISVKLNNEVTLQIGQEEIVEVYNNTDSTIQNGKLCYKTGSYQDIVTVGLANALDDNKSQVLGFATQDIPVGSKGFVTVRGLIHNIDTSMYTIGDNVYLTETDGEFGLDELHLSSRTSKVGVVIKIDSTTGIVYCDIDNENISASLTIKEQNLATGDVNSTGCYFCEGITATIGGTVFNIGAVKGWIVKNTGAYQDKPVVAHIDYTGATGVNITYVGSAKATYILINENQELVQQTYFPTAVQRRHNIFIGTISHTNSAVTIVFNQPDFIQSPVSQLRDMFTPIPFINDGVNIGANGENMSINSSAGILYGLGINYIVDPLSPDEKLIPGSNPVVFQYRTQTSGYGGNTTFLDSNNYDVNGVVTPIPTSGNKFRGTNQRVFLLSNGEYRVQYGQTVYYAENDDNLTDVAVKAAMESFILYPPLKSNGILIGIISIAYGATDLSDIQQARFLRVSKFGDSANSAGGQSIVDLQGAYDNSSEPEIVTNALRGAISFKNGSKDNSKEIFEIKNYEDEQVFNINASGRTTTDTLTISSLEINTGLTKTVVVDDDGNTFYKEIIPQQVHPELTLDSGNESELSLDVANQKIKLSGLKKTFISLNDTPSAYPSGDYYPGLVASGSDVQFSSAYGADSQGFWAKASEEVVRVDDEEKIIETQCELFVLGDGWDNPSGCTFEYTGGTGSLTTQDYELIASKNVELGDVRRIYNIVFQVTGGTVLDVYISKNGGTPIYLITYSDPLNPIDGMHSLSLGNDIIDTDDNYSFIFTATGNTTISGFQLSYISWWFKMNYFDGPRLVDGAHNTLLKYPTNAGEAMDISCLDEDGKTMIFKPLEELLSETDFISDKDFETEGFMYTDGLGNYNSITGVVMDSDFTVAGYMKTDGNGNYSVEENISITGTVMDSDFTTAGLMKTDGNGNYSTIVDNSNTWNTLGTLGTKTFWEGSQAQFDAIVTKDTNTIYFIYVET